MLMIYDGVRGCTHLSTPLHFQYTLKLVSNKLVVWGGLVLKILDMIEYRYDLRKLLHGYRRPQELIWVKRGLSMWEQDGFTKKMQCGI